MPEGPEIRRVADRLSRVIAGRTVERVQLELPELKRFERTLEGCRVEWVTSRGKALLTRFSNGLTLYSHNQLYGRWYLCRRGRWPATHRSLRVALHTDVSSAILYSASDIAVMEPAALAAHPFLCRLGPDVLDEELTWRTIAERLRDPRFRGRSLAALYLDQGFLAGVGNYLRSEILFHARVDPSLRPADLHQSALGRLARSTLALCRRAYATAGVTNPPGRVNALRRNGARRREYRFAIFDREAQPCYRCGGPVLRTEATSRRLYFCAHCQAP